MNGRLAPIRALTLALALAVAPTAAQAEDVLSSTSSSTSDSGGSGSGPMSDGPSTAEVIVSPFHALATSIEATTDQLELTSTQVGVVMLAIVTVIAILAAVGLGIYLTVRAASGSETAFRRYLRHQRLALHQAVVAGHGPVMEDLAALFGIEHSYPAFAHLVAQQERTVRGYLAPAIIEADGPRELALLIVRRALFEPEIVRDWLAEGRIGLRFGPWPARIRAE